MAPDKIYTGILAETVYVEALEELDLGEDTFRHVTEEKTQALLEHYGLEEGDWYFLALKLALDHVPGFQVRVKAKSGRKSEWTMGRVTRLVSDVGEYLVKNPDQSEMAACTYLLKQGNQYGRIRKPRSLCTKFSEFKKFLFHDYSSLDTRRNLLVNRFAISEKVFDMFAPKQAPKA